MPANHCMPHTKEAKRKISESHIGKPCPWNRQKSRFIDGIELFECSKCRKFLPKDAFYKDKLSFAGIKSQCKICHRETTIKTRDPDNARRINREYMRRARQTNPGKYRVRERLATRQRPKNEKTKAREILNGAVVSGKIIKPTNCSQCGKLRKVTAHHDDYSKPLQVKWLCYECHSNH